MLSILNKNLAETGNIILNACLATIANILRRTMRMSLPSVDARDLLPNAGISSIPTLIWSYFSISTLIKNRDIRGHHPLLMDLPSVTALKRNCARLYWQHQQAIRQCWINYLR